MTCCPSLLSRNRLSSFISTQLPRITLFHPRTHRRNHQKAIPFGRIVGAEAVRPTLTKRQCRRAETAAGQRIAAEAKAAKAAGIATSSRAGTAQAPNSTTALTKDVDTNHINNSSNGEVGSAASGNDGAVAPTIAASSVTATGSRTALSSAATSPDKARGSSKPLSQKQLYIQQEKDLLLQDVASKGPIVLRVAELYEPKRECTFTACDCPNTHRFRDASLRAWLTRMLDLLDIIRY